MPSIIKNIRKFINSIDQDYEIYGNKWYNQLIRKLYILIMFKGFPTGTIQGALKFFLIVVFGSIIVGTILLLLLFGGSYVYYGLMQK